MTYDSCNFTDNMSSSYSGGFHDIIKKYTEDGFTKAKKHALCFIEANEIETFGNNCDRIISQDGTTEYLASLLQLKYKKENVKLVITQPITFTNGIDTTREKNIQLLSNTYMEIFNNKDIKAVFTVLTAKDNDSEASHQNIIMVDRLRKKVIRFEPIGTTIKKYDFKINKFICEVFERIHPRFEKCNPELLENSLIKLCYGDYNFNTLNTCRAVSSMMAVFCIDNLFSRYDITKLFKKGSKTMDTDINRVLVWILQKNVEKIVNKKKIFPYIAIRSSRIALPPGSKLAYFIPT